MSHSPYEVTQTHNYWDGNPKEKGLSAENSGLSGWKLCFEPLECSAFRLLASWILTPNKHINTTVCDKHVLSPVSPVQWYFHGWTWWKKQGACGLTAVAKQGSRCSRCALSPLYFCSCLYWHIWDGTKHKGTLSCICFHFILNLSVLYIACNCTSSGNSYPRKLFVK